MVEHLPRMHQGWVQSQHQGPGRTAESELVFGADLAEFCALFRPFTMFPLAQGGAGTGSTISAHQVRHVNEKMGNKATSARNINGNLGLIGDKIE